MNWAVDCCDRVVVRSSGEIFLSILMKDYFASSHVVGAEKPHTTDAAQAWH